MAYSEKDDVFFSKIEGIDGLVNFEGQSVTELKESFHEAVDYYIAALAKMEGISINAFIKETIDARLAAM